MTFADKLKILMSVFRISSINLARGIGVDPSLVSRWRSGERAPAGLAGYEDIGAFLSGRPMLPHDRAALIQTVRDSCKTQQDTAAAITRWLAGEAVAPEPSRDLTEILQMLPGALDDFFKTTPNLHTGPVNLWPQVQKGHPAEHEIFRGNQGKRQSVINFFHAAIGCTRPLDIFLCTDGDHRWITENDAFAVLWERSLHTMCRQGHTIHRVHMGEMNARELLVALQSNANLFATGRFVLHICPSMRDAVRNSLFVAKGYAVQLSHRTNTGEIYSTLYKSPQDTEIYGDICLTYLDSGLQLAQAFPSLNPLTLMEKQTKLEELPGRCMAYCCSPGMLNLPEETLVSLLRAQLPPSQIEARLDLLARRRELLGEGRDYRVELWPESVLEAILINESCRIAGAELTLPEDATLRGTELLDMLRYTRNLLVSCPHYSLYFVDGAPLAAGIQMKENLGCFFISDNCTALFTAEPELLRALSGWFEEALRQDRQKSIDRLDAVIAEIQS